MKSAPPSGSRITVDTFNQCPLIIIPHQTGGIMRYFMGAFLIFWMGGWFMGFTSAFTQIISGKGDAFLIFWLGGWSVGGFFAGYTLYRVLRKSSPEQLFLNQPALSIDTGIPPFMFSFDFKTHKEYWNSMFPKRKRLVFTPSEVQTLALRETDHGNRLTIDQGMERLELASGATEIEREWLYNYLMAHYT